MTKSQKLPKLTKNTKILLLAFGIVFGAIVMALSSQAVVNHAVTKSQGSAMVVHVKAYVAPTTTLPPVAPTCQAMPTYGPAIAGTVTYLDSTGARCDATADQELYLETH